MSCASYYYIFTIYCSIGVPGSSVGESLSWVGKTGPSVGETETDSLVVETDPSENEIRKSEHFDHFRNNWNQLIGKNDFVRDNEKSSPLFHLSLRITFRICDEVHHDDDVNWFH
jgi:hypothetical protein